jgi:hypothetical protein
MKLRVGIFQRIAGLLTLVGMAMYCHAGRAQSVSLAWDADTAPDTAGYYLYFGTSSGHYTSKIDVGNNTVITLAGLKQNTIVYFAVTAYNTSRQESPPSNQAQFEVPVPSLTPQMAVVTPASGPPGSQVYISGVNFLLTTMVEFGGVPANFTISSDSLIVATVPPGARSGVLSVNTQYGVVNNQFTVTALPPPANTNFASAQVLTGSAALATVNTTGETVPAPVWYRWTAPSTGAWTFNTSGSDFTPLLNIYTGSNPGSLVGVASNQLTNGTLTSALVFNATGGVTYQISLAGVKGAVGTIDLSIAAPYTTITVYSNNFEASQGFNLSVPLAGQNNWVSTGSAATGLQANQFPGQGQQATLGYSSSTPGTASRLYVPLNYNVDTNNRPFVQFSVMMQVSQEYTFFNNVFSWQVVNASGHELFRVSFDNNTGGVTYTLDNGAGPVPTTQPLVNSLTYNLVVSMDFRRNQWSATLSGAPLVTNEPITTTGAALTLGNIAAGEGFLNPAYPGPDGMLFDNYVVTAGPGPAPLIFLGPQSQTVPAGGNLLLGVVASGQAPMSYQWYFNSGAIPNATNTTYAITNISPTQAGSYLVAVANPGGIASSSATVSVTAVPPKASFAAPITLGTNGALLSLALSPDNNYTLQTSTNLSNWVSILAFYANGTNAVWIDPNAKSYRSRFYRLVSP